MASAKRRLHRRKRRRARVKYPKMQRIGVNCYGSTGAKPNRHWLYVTEKGDILLREHRGIDFKHLAYEAGLSSKPPGCLWAVLRLLAKSDEDLGSHFDQRRTLDFENFTDGTRKFFEGIWEKRSDRDHMRMLLDACEMLPISQNLVYRRNLLTARFRYRVDALSCRVMARRGDETPDAGSTAEEFNTAWASGGDGDQFQLWDY